MFQTKVVQKIKIHILCSVIFPENCDVNDIQWLTRNFVRGGGLVQQIQLDRGQRERGSGSGSPLLRGSGGSCNLVQEISFHIVKFS
jgi:hypothetical protein